MCYEIDKYFGLIGKSYTDPYQASVYGTHSLIEWYIQQWCVFQATCPAGMQRAALYSLHV